MTFPQSLSFAGQLVRDQTVADLLAPAPVEDPGNELFINMADVTTFDVVTAVAMRMRIARHLREHPKGHVTVWLPRSSRHAYRVVDLLRPLPEEVKLVGDISGLAPANFALVPATQVPTATIANIVGEYAYDACLKARLSQRRTAYIAEAVVELTNNALRHASDAPDPPVVAVASFGRERSVELAVLDTGTAVSGQKKPAESLAALPGLPIQGHEGFLSNILRRAAKRDVDVKVQIYSGTGRLLWTPFQHRTESGGVHVPGMTVVARIGP